MIFNIVVFLSGLCLQANKDSGCGTFLTKVVFSEAKKALS